MLYPTELLGHISKIFNFPPPTDSNELPLRRRALYPGEVQGHVLNFPRTEDGLLIIRRTTNSLPYDSLTLHSASFCVKLAQ